MDRKGKKYRHLFKDYKQIFGVFWVCFVNRPLSRHLTQGEYRTRSLCARREGGNSTDTTSSMVLMLDGSSEIGAHVWSEIPGVQGALSDHLI